MIIQLKSNGQKIVISLEGWNKMKKDQQLRYVVLDKNEANDKNEQKVVNEVTKPGASETKKK